MLHHEACDCHVCKVPHFERNNYFHGKTLSARDLSAEQSYFNEKRWLINRMILGWGIVCGLEVTMENGCLAVTPGLALDCCGRELLVCDREMLHGRMLADALQVDPCGSSPPIPWALCLEYHECRTEAVALPPSCDHKDRGRDYNRIRDDYRLVFRHWKDACPEDHSVDCCPYDGLGRKVSLHKALVDRARKCAVCKHCECVLIATGHLHTAPQQAPRIALDPDSWKYRRIVYTNPALAGVIRCVHGGLAHITGINWKLRYQYGAEEFIDLLQNQHLHVTFDRPLNESSVKNPKSCRLSIFITGGDDNCPTEILIPVRHVDYKDRTAIYYFDEDCVLKRLRPACQSLRKTADVELVLHGSMILDTNGRALDAELIGDFPTGNGVEAGEFIAYFAVGP